jgi:hypothetical protein
MDKNSQEFAEATRADAYLEVQLVGIARRLEITPKEFFNLTLGDDIGENADYIAKLKAIAKSRIIKKG